MLSQVYESGDGGDDSDDEGYGDARGSWSRLEVTPGVPFPTLTSRDTVITLAKTFRTRHCGADVVRAPDSGEKNKTRGAPHVHSILKYIMEWGMWFS